MKTKQTRRKSPSDFGQAVCPVCSKQFTLTRSWQKCCSRKCRQQTFMDNYVRKRVGIDAGAREAVESSKLKVEDDVIYFSSGRTLGVNGGVLGLGLDPNSEDHFEGIHEGFDSIAFNGDGKARFEGSQLGPEDFIELATFMISAWKRVREKYEKGVKG